MAPSRLRMEQLRARKLEIDEVGQGLIREYADINREIEHRKDGGRARHGPRCTPKDPHRRWGPSSLCPSQPEHRRSNRLAAWPSGGHDVRGSLRSPGDSHVARACSGAAGGKFVVSTTRTRHQPAHASLILVHRRRSPCRSAPEPSPRYRTFEDEEPQCNTSGVSLA